MKNKIFIVEDDETIVKLLREKLQEEFHVTSVMNFRAVAAEIAEYQPDLVLMDITRLILTVFIGRLKFENQMIFRLFLFRLPLMR